MDSIDNLLDLSSVNSLTINTKIKKLTELLISVETSSMKKINIANFLCHKLYDIYNLKDTTKDAVTSSISSIVYNDNTLPTPLRLYYLRFRNEEVSYNVSLSLYMQGIRYILEHIPYFQVLKYILRNSKLSEQHKQNIYREFNDIFNDQDVSNFTKMEIADIFLMNGKHQRGEEMLNYLRRNDGYHPPPPPQHIVLIDRPTNLYEDTQNVHNSDINKAVLKVASNLIKQEGHGDFEDERGEEMMFNELVGISSEHLETFVKVLERINIDTSKFVYGVNRFTLRLVFVNLWSYIGHHQHSVELKKRLVEEMIEMEKYCTTGHLSRFVSVIQGYTNDEELMITISDYEYLKGKIKYFLDKKLQEEAPERVRESMIGDRKEFIEYVDRLMIQKTKEFLREYFGKEEEVLKIIKEIVDVYTGGNQTGLS
jgi:hypothetical protein